MPGWPTLVEQIKLADATPVIVHTHAEDGFTVRAEPILAAITPRTRGIIINSPGNPTGALISEQDMAAIADEAAKRGIWVLLDLCYDKLIYDATPHNLPRVLFERLRDHTVLCGSASKAYAMTGWRCGWAVGPAALVGAWPAHPAASPRRRARPATRRWAARWPVGRGAPGTSPSSGSTSNAGRNRASRS